MELCQRDLIARLKVTPATLATWRAEGMPAERRKGKFIYDAALIAAWMLENGKAKRKEDPSPAPPPAPQQHPILLTRGELAKYFQVNVRTVGTWLEDPSFPGKVGDAGKRNGNYPVKAIADWMVASQKKGIIPPELTATTATPDAVPRITSRDKLIEIKTAQATIELHKMQGKMIDAEEAAAFYRRTCSYAATVLSSLPARLLADLPNAVEDKTRSTIYQIAQRVVNETRSMLAELIEGDKDKKERWNDSDSGPVTS